MIRFKTLVMALAIGVLLVSCSDDDKPGSFCPLIDDQGPTILPGDVHLFVANSLGEDYVAASLREGEFTPKEQRGLTGQAPNDMIDTFTQIFIVNSLDNNIQRIDLWTGRTDACLDLGENTSPWRFNAVTKLDTRAWVTGWVSGEIIEIDLSEMRVLRRATAGPGAEGSLVTEDRVAVTLTGYDGAENVYKNGEVVVFDKSDLSEVARLEVPANAQDIFTGADGLHHVVCTGNYVDVFGQVVRIEADWSAVRDTLVLGGSPAVATLDADHAIDQGRIAYLPSYFGGILAYDTLDFTVVHDIGNPLRGDLGYIALAHFDGKLYAANFETDTVEEIDPATGEVLRSFISGDGPAALCIAALPIPN